MNVAGALGWAFRRGLRAVDTAPVPMDFLMTGFTSTLARFDEAPLALVALRFLIGFPSSSTSSSPSNSKSLSSSSSLSCSTSSSFPPASSYSLSLPSSSLLSPSHGTVGTIQPSPPFPPSLHPSTSIRQTLPPLAPLSNARSHQYTPCLCRTGGTTAPCDACTPTCDRPLGSNCFRKKERE